MFNGPTSWTTGAMPEVFQCRLALCPYEEMAAQITGTVDATESGSCNKWYVTILQCSSYLLSRSSSNSRFLFSLYYLFLSRSNSRSLFYSLSF